MNYTQLTNSINELAEYTFTAEQIKLFVQQTEKFIYNMYMFPALRKNMTGNITSGLQYLSLPSDFIWTYSLVVIDASNNYTFLVNKDVNFIREAYPNNNSVATPKHYALFDKDSIILGPTPDATYKVELHYGYYPESIVTANTTWLGDTFDNALLNGSMVEAARFNKLEEDIVANYQKMFEQSMKLLGNLTTGRLRSDTYRSGQARQPAN
jgi:hypothetical protein